MSGNGRSASKALVLGALLALAPQLAFAQSGRAVTNWTCNCPRGPMEVPNSMNGPPPDCRSVCYPSGSGGSAGAGGGLTALQSQMATQVGTALGTLMREALFGNPQAE